MTIKTKMSTLIVISILGSFATIPAVTSDTNDSTKTIKHRQALMATVKDSIKPLRQMMKSGNIDAETLRKSASAMAAATAQAVDAFRTNTAGIHIDTEAKDAIWQNWADFEMKMINYDKDVQSFNMLAQGGDSQKAMGALRKVTQNCKGCHDDYREEQDH